MSIADSGQNARISNPSEVYLTWSGKEDMGCFTYYDKEAKETVKVDDVSFVVLDVRASVGGWCDELESRLYSNLVLNTKKEEFTVKAMKNNKVIAQGLYEDIKDTFGLSFTTNMFCMATIGGERKACQISFSGAFLGQWFNTVEEVGGPYDVHDYVFSVADTENKKKGSNKFIVPVFGYEDIDPSVKEEAVDFYNLIYKQYLTQDQTEESVEQTEETADSAEEAVPF